MPHVIPVAKSRLKVSGDSQATCRPRYARRANARSTPHVPISPSSSPITAKNAVRVGERQIVELPASHAEAGARHATGTEGLEYLADVVTRVARIASTGPERSRSAPSDSSTR